MWSAGVIFYSLVCKELPFQSQERKTTFTLIKEKDPDMEHPCFRIYSREMKDLIYRMLTKNPKKRITPEVALTHNFFLKKGLVS